ncbi:MAG: serine hydrolase domain-containing protein [Bacteroidota bacterium]
MLLLALLSAQWGHAQLLDQLKKEVGKIIYYDTNLDLDQIPGFVIAVQLGDSSYVWGNGTLDQQTTTPVDGQTVFELGGLTKVFTASLVNLLVAEGLMHYDSSFNSYLPLPFRNSSAQHLTIRHLVQHTSGLPRVPHEFGLKEKDSNNPYAHYTFDDLLKFYQKYLFEHKGAAKYQYAHTNYALLEYAIEQVTQQKFEQVLEQKILRPLAMPNTWVNAPQDTTLALLSPGHSRSGLTRPAWTFEGAFRASEGLKSNADDLLLYLQANLGIGPEDLCQNFAQNHDKSVDTEIQQQTYIGNGWHVMKMKKYYDVILHAGATDGHRAFVAFVKETRTGVILLSNSELGMQGLGILILRMINQNWKKPKKKKKKKH